MYIGLYKTLHWRLRMRLKKILFGIFGIGALQILLPACEQETDIQYVVQSELQPYFDRFYMEGSARGKQLDLETLNGLLGDLPGVNVLGRCEQSSETRTVTIDDAFWRKADTYQREYVVFHELGHCVLNRRHLEDQNADGTCASMMQSGNSTCRMTYNAQTRAKYLDELFK